MKVKITAALALLSIALAPAAFSQEQTEVSGFYVGGGVGQFNAGIDDVDELDETVEGWDEDDTAYKFFAGYRLNRFVGVELDYINLGEPSGAVVPGRNVDAAVDGFAPYVIGTVPLGPYFEVFGRLGYYFYDATRGQDDGLGGRVEFDEESEDLVWGGGIGANVGEKFNVRLEYERFDLQGLDDADALWLNAAWRF
jgi:opacity protein-like surface antigen